MKQIKITLTEQQWIDLNNLIGEIPTKFGNPLVNILIPNALESQTETDPKPIGTGGGGTAKPPKDE